MRTNLFLYICTIAVCSFSYIYTIGDNRFIPLFSYIPLRPDQTESYAAVSLIAASASSAFNTSEREVGIPEIEGNFDLGVLGRAVQQATGTNPLRSYFQDKSIPYFVDGRLQMQGFSCAFFHQIIPEFGIGASWYAMRVNTHNIFNLGDTIFPAPASIQTELDGARRSVFTQLGIRDNHTAQVGFGDIDLFARAGNTWDHVLKFRTIQAGIAAGIIFPTGSRRELFSASSIPFGGNGHWGTHITIDALFELRQDLKIGFNLDIIKRFSRTHLERLPVLTEPYLFGAIVGGVRINPGITTVFTPYMTFEHLRHGLGFGLYYTLTMHGKDKWTDVRMNKSVPVNLAAPQNNSRWGSDYITAQAFYDFGVYNESADMHPIASFKWDIPLFIFVTKRVAKTHKLTFSIECDY